MRSWLGEPSYGPPADSFPEPDGIAVHYVNEDMPQVAAPASAPLLLAALSGLFAQRQIGRAHV